MSRRRTLDAARWKPYWYTLARATFAIYTWYIETFALENPRVLCSWCWWIPSPEDGLDDTTTVCFVVTRLQLLCTAEAELQRVRAERLEASAVLNNLDLDPTYIKLSKRETDTQDKLEDVCSTVCHKSPNTTNHQQTHARPLTKLNTALRVSS